MSFGLRKGIENASTCINEAIEKAFEKKRTGQLIYKNQVEYCTFRKSELDQQEK
jgi:hypothetical protein